MKPDPRTVYRRLVVPALRILIGGVFIYAGQAKIRDPATFADSIASFRLLPSALDNLMALGLPPFEILLGGLLIIGWRRRMAAFCAMLATAIFLMALVSAWIRGIPVDCGCFGSGNGAGTRTASPWLSVGRDLLLLAGTLMVYIDAWHSESRPIIDRTMS